MTEYLFVTEIEVERASEPDLTIYKKEDVDVGPQNGDFDLPPIRTQRIKARAYRNNGEYVYIGLCKKAEDLLGIPLRTRENLERETRQLRKECEYKIAEIKNLQKAYEGARKVIADFRELPWYSRLWRALRRDF